MRRETGLPETESILDSVKVQLGLTSDNTAFDADLIMTINMAISTLRQIGVGPSEGFTVVDKTQTYDDYIGQDSSLLPMVKKHLYEKTRNSFDPPQNASLLENLKSQIAEHEWRLQVEAELPMVFEE